MIEEKDGEGARAGRLRVSSDQSGRCSTSTLRPLCKAAVSGESCECWLLTRYRVHLRYMLLWDLGWTMTSCHCNNIIDVMQHRVHVPRSSCISLLNYSYNRYRKEVKEQRIISPAMDWPRAGAWRSLRSPKASARKFRVSWTGGVVVLSSVGVSCFQVDVNGMQYWMPSSFAPSSSSGWILVFPQSRASKTEFLAHRALNARGSPTAKYGNNHRQSSMLHSS